MHRNLAAKAKKNIIKLRTTDGSLVVNSGSGCSSTAPPVRKPSLQATSSRLKHSRPDDDLVDLTTERLKSKFCLPPVFYQLRFFEGNSLELDRAESLHLEEIYRTSRRLLLAQDSTTTMRLFSMASVYANEETSLELELRRV